MSSRCVRKCENFLPTEIRVMKEKSRNSSYLPYKVSPRRTDIYDKSQKTSQTHAHKEDTSIVVTKKDFRIKEKKDERSSQLCNCVLDSERLYRVLSTGVHKEDLPRFTLFSSLLYPKVISIFWSPLAKNSMGTK